MLRAFVDRLRSGGDARRRRAEIDQGRHLPGEPIIPSEEGSREVLDEIINGSPLTPERRETFELMRQMAGVRRRRPGRMRLMSEVHRYSDGLLEPSDDPYRRTPLLSPEGSREVEEEMAAPPADMPGRRALFERVEVRAAMRRRVKEMELNRR